MLSFVIAEEDLWIKTFVFLLNNSRFHHTSHSDEPLSYIMHALCQWPTSLMDAVACSARTRTDRGCVEEVVCSCLVHLGYRI